MTIFRAPRPKNGWTEIDNRLLRNKELSFKARGILSYILSHTENWATDAQSIAKASDKDGRDAVQSGLKELELKWYLHRRKWQNPANGQWRTDSYVFDQPVAPADVDKMLRPVFDQDQVDEVGDGPDWANEQVSPETGNPVSDPEPGFPASGNPTPGKPTSGDPTPEKPALTDRKTKEERPSRRGAGLAAQGAGARELTRPAPPRRNRPQGQIPQGHDEFGPLSPKCPDHVDVAGDPPCNSCKRTREAFEAAAGKRAMAEDRRRTQDLLQAQNRAAASRTVPPQEAARVARAELARVRAARSASGAPDPAGEPPTPANGSQELVEASEPQGTRP